MLERAQFLLHEPILCLIPQLENVKSPPPPNLKVVPAPLACHDVCISSGGHNMLAGGC